MEEKKPLTKQQIRQLNILGFWFMLKGLFFGFQAALLMLLMNWTVYMINVTFFNDSFGLMLFSAIVIGILVMGNLGSLQRESKAKFIEKANKILGK